MLYLIRKPGETIHIGDDITITVAPASEVGNNIRFGIDAPKDVVVDRDEVRVARQATANEIVTIGLCEREGPPGYIDFYSEDERPHAPSWTRWVQTSKATAERWSRIEAASNAAHDEREALLDTAKAGV